MTRRRLTTPWGSPHRLQVRLPNSIVNRVVFILLGLPPIAANARAPHARTAVVVIAPTFRLILRPTRPRALRGACVVRLVTAEPMVGVAPPDPRRVCPRPRPRHDD